MLDPVKWLLSLSLATEQNLFAVCMSHGMYVRRGIPQKFAPMGLSFEGHFRSSDVIRYVRSSICDFLLVMHSKGIFCADSEM